MTTTTHDKALSAAVETAPKYHRWTKLSLPEIFEASYIPEPNSGCWIWLGVAYRTKSYKSPERPVLNFKNSRRYAYQISYELHVGQIPQGKQICHRCNNPICVNPDHLYAGESIDNHRDAIIAGSHNSVKLRKVAFEKAASEGRIYVPRVFDLKLIAARARDRRKAKKLPAPPSTPSHEGREKA